MRKTLLFVGMLCLLAAVALAQVATPPAPTNLVATQAASAVASTKLTWDGPTGSYGFQVYRSKDDTSHFEKLALASSTVYNDYGVAFGHTYYYYVTTVSIASTSNRLVESPRSNIAQITFTVPVRATGIIAGKVTDDSTGKPIGHMPIYFYRQHSVILTDAILSAVTDSLGEYSAKLDTGVYKILAQPYPSMSSFAPTYQPEWFDDKKDMASADTVIVHKDASVIANFGLSKPTISVPVTGIISGTVIDDSTGLPIPGALISFHKKSPSTSPAMPTAITDSLGFYSATLDTGSYLVHAEGVVRASVKTPYVPEWYDNVTDVTLATVISVTSGSTFTANFGLGKPVAPTYAYIEGTVTDTIGTPLRNATVVIRRSFQEVSTLTATAGLVAASTFSGENVDGIGYCKGVAWSGKTDSLGNFKARVVAGHDYVAQAAKWGYLPEYYNNQTNPLLATVITVTADVKGINFSLAPSPIFHNSISGIVRDSTGTGVPSIIVLIPARSDAASHRMRFGQTDSTGTYTIGDVVLGTYVVMAVPYAGYAPAFYKAGSYGIMRWQLADQVLVNGDTSGIDIGVVPISSTGFVRLHGRILAAGLPLPGVRVTATSASGDMVGFGLTNADGAYAIEALPAGAVTITADRESFSTGQQSVSIPVSSYDMSASDLTLSATGTTDVSDQEAVPESYVLGQNYPNPFNPSTVISYQLPVAGSVRLVVFDILGREVAELVHGKMVAGSHETTWSARNVASGVYFYRLTVDNGEKTLFTSTKKMLLVR
jgi:hypothetical protein